MNYGQLFFSFGAGNLFACGMWAAAQGRSMQVILFMVLFSVSSFGLMWSTKLQKTEANQGQPK